MKTFIRSLALIFVALSCSLWHSFADPAEVPSPVERKLYVGSDSTEAILKFSFHVEMRSERKPAKTVVYSIIEAQVQHLFGSMAGGSLLAVPRGDHELELGEPKRIKENLWDIPYQYKGTIVLQNGPIPDRLVVLPINPLEVYEHSINEDIDDSNHEERYACTDPHYFGPRDFWYFWSPDKPGCPLKEHTDYERVKASVTRIKNTQETYPLYARLVQDGEIVSYVLMGMDDPSKNKDPRKKAETDPAREEEDLDENAKNFREIDHRLTQSGYESRILTLPEIREIAPKVTQKNAPFVAEYTKDNHKARLRVRIFFGPSGINEDSSPFHYFLKYAIESASVMIYSGHSGLGGHLDLASIEQYEQERGDSGFKIQSNPDRYQIYFFNSCSSYSYYNSMFFNPKVTEEDPRGIKRQEILTNGLATYFYVMPDTDLALLRSFDLWSRKVRPEAQSYQTLAKNIDSGNLFGVNGDEDKENSLPPDEIERRVRNENDR